MVVTTSVRAPSWHDDVRACALARFVPYPLHKFRLTSSFSYLWLWHISILMTCNVLFAYYVRVWPVNFFSFFLRLQAVETFFSTILLCLHVGFDSSSSCIHVGIDFFLVLPNLNHISNRRCSKIGTISWRSHRKCVLQGRYHQVRLTYLWPRWGVHNQLEANRRPSLGIYQSPQGQAKFESQSKSNCLIRCANPREVLQKIYSHTNNGKVLTYMAEKGGWPDGGRDRRNGLVTRGCRGRQGPGEKIEEGINQLGESDKCSNSISF